MSKRKQPERSAKKTKPESKTSKKEKTPRHSKTAAPEVNPLKKAKAEDSPLDQLKKVCLILNLR